MIPTPKNLEGKRLSIAPAPKNLEGRVIEIAAIGLGSVSVNSEDYFYSVECGGAWLQG